MLKIKPTYGFEAYISDGGYFVIEQESSVYGAQKICLGCEEVIQLAALLRDYESKICEAWNDGVDNGGEVDDA